MPLTPSARPTRRFTNDPVQGRALSKSERRDLRRWFVHAARRSRVAGFDLIRLYGAHGLGIVRHFLSRATNQRTDKHGDPRESRACLAKDVIAEMRDAVGDANPRAAPKAPHGQ